MKGGREGESAGWLSDLATSNTLVSMKIKLMSLQLLRQATKIVFFFFFCSSRYSLINVLAVN